MKSRLKLNTGKDAEEQFLEINKVYGLFNHHNNQFEAIGLDQDGALAHFTQDCTVPVSVAASVSIIRRMESDFCADEKPFSFDRNDDAHLKWWAMLDRELTPNNGEEAVKHALETFIRVSMALPEKERDRIYAEQKVAMRACKKQIREIDKLKASHDKHKSK